MSPRPSRVPVARLHLTAAAVSLFVEAQETGQQVPPEVARAALAVDEALAALDAVKRQAVVSGEVVG